MPDDNLTGHDTAESPSRPSDCRSCASLRAQNRSLADLLVEQTDALHHVKLYALECSERAGGAIDPVTVAARLWPMLSGVPLPVRPCPECVERKVRDRRHADLLVGLAGLQRVEAG